MKIEEQIEQNITACCFFFTEIIVSNRSFFSFSLTRKQNESLRFKKHITLTASIESYIDNDKSLIKSEMHEKKIHCVCIKITHNLHIEYLLSNEL